MSFDISNEEEVKQFKHKLGSLLQTSAKGAHKFHQVLLKSGKGSFIRMTKDLVITKVYGAFAGQLIEDPKSVIGQRISDLVGNANAEKTTREIEESGLSVKMVTFGNIQVIAIAWEDSPTEYGEYLIPLN